MSKWKEREKKAKEQQAPNDPYPARLSDWPSAQDKANRWR